MPTFLSPRNDIVFKRLFGDAHDTEILTAFLKSTLSLPSEDYEEVTLADPHLRRDDPDDKLGVLDVRVKTTSGRMIDIEIQVLSTPDMRERIVFYLAKMVTEQIGSGDSYKKIQPSICILITDYELIGENWYYHNQYRLHDPKTGSVFTDLLEVHILELPKLPKSEDGSVLWDWLKFLDARKEEDLVMLAEKNTEVKKAVGKLMELSADEQTRLLAESREKMQWDINSIKHGAREEGREEGRMEERLVFARKALAQNIPLETIVTLTGLSPDEIRTLH
ncbi:MAG: Rpn family recombination-promoting nuclease/putative transposase [Zoogloeaceae bacterium]|jgi:predicted transposase/invertase (TIGR01784 family)|nr:Rpn family recombination-promoting nuclease/putative transposase [Zoogloeaceae bacterium]